jgi:hypothetical protein
MDITSIITLMMGAVSSSEITVNIDQAAHCSIPEESRLHTQCSENLKLHIILQAIRKQTYPQTDNFNFTYEVLGVVIISLGIFSISEDN